MPQKLGPYGSIAEAEDVYTRALGRFIRQWNWIQHWLQILFLGVLQGVPAPVIISVWNSVQNDRAQRRMLLEATKARIGGFTNSKSAVEDLSWLIKQVDTLGSKRDDAAHSPVSIKSQWLKWEKSGIQTEEMEYTIELKSPALNNRAKNLENKNILEKFEKWEGDAKLIGNYARELGICITAFSLEGADASPSLPKRPILPKDGGRESLDK